MNRCFTVILFVSLVSSLLLVQPSSGQQCGRPVIYSGPSYYPTYTPVKEIVVQEVITPVAVPVIVPAFNFQYVPPPYYQQAPAPTVVPGVTPQPIGGAQSVIAQQPGYQPVAGQPIGAPPGDDSVKKLAQALLVEIKRQESEPQDEGPPMAVAPPGVQLLPQQPVPQQPVPQQPVPQQPGGHPGMLAMVNNCVKCHTGAQAKGGVRIFDSPGVANPLAPRNKILDAVQSGRMPPPGNKTLQPAETAAITSWALGR